MSLKSSILVLAMFMTSACADFDALDGVASARAVSGPYPELVPADALIVAANDGSLTELTASQMAARIAALKRRAARLRARDI